MSIQNRCRALIANDAQLGNPVNHFTLWVEYNVRYGGLPRSLANEMLRIKDQLNLANYESVRRASRKVINEGS